MKPAPLLIAVATGTSLTLAWLYLVNHLVTTATIPGTPRHWAERARTEAYGICYNGCADCLDVGSIQTACLLTAEPVLPHTPCDARRMWYWEDRYPPDCLAAVGHLFRERALWWKRFKLRFLYILAGVTVLTGFAVYPAADRLTAWIRRQYRVRAERRRRRQPSNGPPRTASATTPLLRPATISTALIGVLLLSPSPVSGYACTGWHPVHNQPFVSRTDPSLFGNIHGWLSDCFTETYSCGSKCDDSDKRHQSTTCSPDRCSRERPVASPADYVRRAARLVAACGFKMVDIVPGIVDRRIANPRIEGNLWVKVSVNRFNSSGAVDGQVLCLGDIVRW